MGIYYRNDIVCHPDDVINPNDATHTKELMNIFVWLVTNGAVQLFIVAYTTGMSKHMDRQEIITERENIDEFLDCILPTFVLPYGAAMLFAPAWLIIGSVSFWRDCRDMDPAPVNYLMWVSLPVGYVSMFIWCSFMNRD
jgi:hypothetical protein